MKALKRIVVGHDRRAGGEIALQTAIVLAERCNAELKVIHVVERDYLYKKLSHSRSLPPHGPEEIAEIAWGKVSKRG